MNRGRAVSARGGRRGGAASLVVALDHHFVRCGGRVYTELAFDYRYWSGYLAEFPTVTVAARVADVERLESGYERADGSGVTFLAWPEFRGPVGLVRHLPAVLSAGRRATALGDRFILRNGTVSSIVWLWLVARRRPYAREVQGDMLQSVRQYRRVRGAWLRGALARLADAVARVQVRYSYASSYVSETTRARYPSRHRDREFVFSSVVIGPDELTGPRDESAFGVEVMEILSIGRLEREKGIHLLVEALAAMNEAGRRNWRLRLVGPGTERSSLEVLARARGVGDQIEFLGRVPHGEYLNSTIDRSHLFVLPSLTEGMPRSLIEVMARGTPAVATDVGGVHEILPAAQMCPPGDAAALAALMERMLGSPSLLASASAHGFSRVAEAYSLDVMRKRQREFLAAVKGVRE